MNQVIEVSVQVSVSELWDAVWGSDGAGMTYWATDIRQIDGKPISLWTKPDFEPNPQDFKIYDQEQDLWHTVTLDQLAQGYQKALNAGQHHCGNYALSLDDPDACFGDLVIQYAVFGELTYN